MDNNFYTQNTNQTISQNTKTNLPDSGYLQYPEITLVEQVESRRVQEDLHKIKTHQIITNVTFPLFSSIVFALFFADLFAGIMTAVIWGTLWLLINIGFITSKKPLKKLYKIAYHNDLIRHEEQIRYRERQRLAKQDAPNMPTRKHLTKQIDETIERLNLDKSETNK